MGKLMIFSGASGAGKSFLLEQIVNRDASVEPIYKYTNRPARSYESSGGRFTDLYLGVSEKHIRKLQYHYSYSKYVYGIDRSMIDYHLSRGKSPAVIVRNSRVVRELKRDYPDSFAVYVQSTLSGDDLLRRLSSLGMSDIDMNQRMSRLESDFIDFSGNLDVFDYVLLNNYNRVDFLNQYESILSRERARPFQDGTVCFLTSGNYGQKVSAVRRALIERRQSSEELIEFNELRDGLVVASGVSKRLMQSELAILDFETPSSTLGYYLGLLRAHGKRVVVLGSRTAYSSDDFLHHETHESPLLYEDFEDFETRLREGIHARLNEPTEHGQTWSLHFMEKSIQAARKSTPEDETPRPYVGAVLVDDKAQILLTASRGGATGNKQHAEFQLLSELERLCLADPSLRSRLSDFSLFVTLEPCTARGEGKIPCADRVINSGVGTIYIGMLDPDVRIRGRGFLKLKEAGLRVEMFPHALERELRELNSVWLGHVLDRDYETGAI